MKELQPRNHIVEALFADLVGCAEPVRLLCRMICEKAAKLNCPNSDPKCERDCERMTQLASCGRQMEEFLRCISDKPLTDWQCGDDGEASVKDGVCDEIQAATVECASRF
ncbi:MAG: hypothetical protein JXA30_10445 [Deltaproteobacteria bacterium]|nr:hypothetical protein [Deltaproteobacteria bacterium]